MARIDRATVQKVLDTADIVEVVSDFVTLKKRGANYMGLCPFHNERTPSFSVSPSKGICKCFSCGKGGSPVNFIMEHEQLTFHEAIRYLAKKYNITIRERELTPEEQQAQSDHENMFAVNDFAMRHYEKILAENPEGLAMGASYLKHRGINEDMVKHFRLGFSLEKGDLYETALKRGYSEKYLLSSGLCIKNDQDRIYDRYRGRVIFPVLTVAGKVVAFGARTLRNDKNVAKYVNSPETAIYKKRRELYGFYQAKSEIAKRDKCILVEGYLDVISMHQAGVTNVVASSGTALTPEQIVMIRRFTPNITVIYDSDSAGVKASLRSINMLLAAGMSIKILSLPDGEDPDSFAQKNPSSVVEEYLSTHEIDFISFKTRILVKGTENDPMARANAINDIVTSIAYIPDQIARNIYVKECALAFGIEEKTVLNQVVKVRGHLPPPEVDKEVKEEKKEENPASAPTPPTPLQTALRPYEKEVLRLALKYAMLPFCENVDPEGNCSLVTVIDFIVGDMQNDNVTFENLDLGRTLNEAYTLANDEYESRETEERDRIHSLKAVEQAQGEETIRNTAQDSTEISRMHQELLEKIDADANERMENFQCSYIANLLLSHPENDIREIATELLTEKHTLSKIHTRFVHVESEKERLHELVPRAIYELKDTILSLRIKDKAQKITSVDDPLPLMREIKEIEELRRNLSPLIGERVITPK